MSYFLPLALAIAFNTADKVIARRTLRTDASPDAYLLVYQLICFFVSVPPALLSVASSTTASQDFHPEATKLLLLVCGTMIAWSLFGISTFRSAAQLELSISATISRSKLLWTALLGICLFNETLTTLHIVGLVVIFFANLSLKKVPVHLLNPKGVSYAVLSAISLSIAMALDKWLLEYLSASVVLCVGFAGSTLTSLAINRQTSVGDIRRVFLSSALAGLTGSVGYYCLLIAMDKGNLSVVVPIYQSAHIVFVLAGILVLREYTGLRAKLFSAVISALGISLIFLGS